MGFDWGAGLTAFVETYLADRQIRDAKKETEAKLKILEAQEKTSNDQWEKEFGLKTDEFDFKKVQDGLDRLAKKVGGGGGAGGIGTGTTDTGLSGYLMGNIFKTDKNGNKTYTSYGNEMNDLLKAVNADPSLADTIPKTKRDELYAFVKESEANGFYRDASYLETKVASEHPQIRDINRMANTGELYNNSPTRDYTAEKKLFSSKYSTFKSQEEAEKFLQTLNVPSAIYNTWFK